MTPRPRLYAARRAPRLYAARRAVTPHRWPGAQAGARLQPQLASAFVETCLRPWRRLGRGACEPRHCCQAVSGALRPCGPFQLLLCYSTTSVRGGRGGEPARARLRAARAHQHAHYNAQSFSKNFGARKPCAKGKTGCFRAQPVFGLRVLPWRFSGYCFAQRGALKCGVPPMGGWWWCAPKSPFLGSPWVLGPVWLIGLASAKRNRGPVNGFLHQCRFPGFSLTG